MVLVKRLENDENTRNVMETNAKMVRLHQLTEGDVGMNSEGTGEVQKERWCPGMMNICSQEVGYMRSDGDMVSKCDTCVGNDKRRLVTCDIVTESAASDVALLIYV